jgi:hypothetical protein
LLSLCAFKTLAEAWNGATWALQPTPHPEQGLHQLLGVSCTSSSACTAVWSTSGRTIAASWNGISWALQHTASPAGSTAHLLGSVSCARAGGCTAVGAYQAPTGRLTLAEARH